jgi:excisionase family DNA binding protein
MKPSFPLSQSAVAQGSVAVEELTPRQAAELKGVTRSAIYKAVAEGRLRHHMRLDRIALLAVDVEAWEPSPHIGRPPGIAMSESARANISVGQKRRWKTRKSNVIPKD